MNFRNLFKKKENEELYFGDAFHEAVTTLIQLDREIELVVKVDDQKLLRHLQARRIMTTRLIDSCLMELKWIHEGKTKEERDKIRMEIYVERARSKEK